MTANVRRSGEDRPSEAVKVSGRQALGRGEGRRGGAQELWGTVRRLRVTLLSNSIAHPSGCVCANARTYNSRGAPSGGRELWVAVGSAPRLWEVRSRGSLCTCKGRGRVGNLSTSSRFWCEPKVTLKRDSLRKRNPGMQHPLQ